MATPALRALRRAHPAAQITLSGRRWTGELLAGIGSFDHFLPEAPRGLGPLAAQARALRAGRFDWAVLLPDAVRAALPPWLARVPLRVGYARDPLRRALLTRALQPPGEGGQRAPISMIERYLRITRALGCADAGAQLDLAVHAQARARVAERLAALGVRADEPLVVVAPGARFGSSKLWPPQHFARAADALADKLGARIALAPGPGEEPIARAIAAQMRARALELSEPPTTLPELAALVARARLLLCNDTGARHIAVALGTPVVTLMGPTDPRHTAHLLERQRVLREPVECSPCHLKTCPIDHRCMTRLSPERAVEAALELVS
jgi:heptosyltransferase-2